MNKEGISFYMSLGLLVLFSAVVLSTANFVVQHANLVFHNINSLEVRMEATEALEEATKLIENRKFVDPTFLQNVSARTGVGITVMLNDTLELTYSLSDTEEYVIYLDTIYLYDELFQYAFRGIGDPDAFVTVDHMLKNYMYYLIEKTYGPITLYPEKVETFQDVIDYTEQMALAGELFAYDTSANFSLNQTPIITQSTFVSGSVSFIANGAKTIHVPEDMVLIIDGDFTADRFVDIDGTLIVNGNVVISGNSNGFYGTIYTNGNFTGPSKLDLPLLSTEPAFVFSNGLAYLDNNCDGNLYFYGESIGVKNGYESQIIGGIYSKTQSQLILQDLFRDPTTLVVQVNPNLSMTEFDFEQFGVLAILNKTNEEYKGYDATTLVQRTK